MRSRNFLFRLFLAAGVAILIPSVSFACPGCLVNDPKTASTYLGMTLLMSALPMLLVCGLAYWLWRKHS